MMELIIVGGIWIMILGAIPKFIRWWKATEDPPDDDVSDM